MAAPRFPGRALRSAGTEAESLGETTWRFGCANVSCTLAAAGRVFPLILPMSIAPCIVAMQKSASPFSSTSFERRPLAFG